MEAHYIGFNMWVKAVEKAGTHDPDAVIDACRARDANLTGGTATMLPNHHITKPVLIGEIQDDGQFESSGRPRCRSGAGRCLVRLPGIKRSECLPSVGSMR
jgi:urea transport system substrate-binding protein